MYRYIFVVVSHYLRLKLLDLIQSTEFVLSTVIFFISLLKKPKKRKPPRYVGGTTHHTLQYSNYRPGAWTGLVRQHISDKRSS